MNMDFIEIWARVSPGDGVEYLKEDLDLGGEELQN